MTDADRRPAEVRCGLCNTPVRVFVPAEHPAFGSPDLDTRANGPVRSTLRDRVQRCPCCGHCAADLATPWPGAGEGIAQPEYRALLGDTALPEGCAAFLCRAQLESGAGRYDAAVWSTLSAAWLADDATDEPAADRCRTMALTALRMARAAGRPIGVQPGVDLLLEVDLLRRTGRFTEASACIRRAQHRALGEIVGRLLGFQQDLIAEEDRRAHAVIEGLRDSG